jgi:hypothetical protein
MNVHLFSGTGWVFGFTERDSGDNLPPDYGPWIFHKTLDLNRGDKRRSIVNADECLDDIEQYGFHVTESRVRITEKIASN